MDENEFLGKWISESRNLHCDVGDVRARVWEKIAEAEGRSAGLSEEMSAVSAATLFKLDIAAATVIAMGSGAIYFLLSEFSNTVFRMASLQVLAGAYY